MERKCLTNISYFHIKINSSLSQHATNYTIYVFVLLPLLPFQFHNNNLFSKHSKKFHYIFFSKNSQLKKLHTKLQNAS